MGQKRERERELLSRRKVIARLEKLIAFSQKAKIGRENFDEVFSLAETLSLSLCQSLSRSSVLVWHSSSFRHPAALSLSPSARVGTEDEGGNE